MKYIICYDITENKIRQRVAKLLETWAARVQNSVFIGELTVRQAASLQQEILRLTKKAREPLLMMVPLCATCEEKLWIKGIPREDWQEQEYIIF